MVAWRNPGSLRVCRALFVAAVVVAAPMKLAHADERTDQAASLLRLGQGALERGEHAVALAAFDQSDALAPTVAARLGAARALAATGRLVAARRRALDAVTLAPSTPDPADDADGTAAQALAASLSPRLASLFVRVVPADATLTVDGVPAEATRSIELDPGEHVAEAAHAGRERQKRTIRLAEGERTEVELVLPPRSAAPPLPAKGPPAVEAPTRAPPLAIVGFLGAVTGLAVGVPFGVATLSTLTGCPESGCAEETKDDAALTGGVAIAGLSVFAIGLTVGIVALLVDDGDAPRAARAITCPGRVGFCVAF